MEAQREQLELECGERVVLQHAPTGYSLELLVEPVQRGKVMLARPAAPYHRLQHSAQHTTKLTWKPTAGNAAAMWVFVPVPTEDGVLVQAVRRKGSPLVFLAIDDHGALVAEESSGACFRLQRSAVSRGLAESSSASAGAAASFEHDGYVVLPGLVPADKVDRALRLLNHHLGSADLKADVEPDGIGMEYERAVSRPDAEGEGEGEGAAAPRGVVKLGSGRRCTCCLAQSSELLALLGTRERRAVCEAVGARALSGPCGCQVALRFPLRPFGEGVLDGEAALPSLLPHAEAQWHTDAAKYNGKKSFDVVAGIFLSPLEGCAQGNLWVHPGSHLRERAAREGGLLAGRALHSSHAYSHATATPISAAAPGSVIVFDKDLVHAGGPNLSPGIRYALYFRLRFEPSTAL